MHAEFGKAELVVDVRGKAESSLQLTTGCGINELPVLLLLLLLLCSLGRWDFTGGASCLSSALLHALPDDARDDVRAAREGEDGADRLDGVLLGRRGERQRECEPESDPDERMHGRLLQLKRGNSFRQLSKPALKPSHL